MRAAATSSLEHLGSVVDLSLRTVRSLFRPPFTIRDLLRQVESIGVKSLPIAVLTAVFSALVMTIQTGVQLARFGSREYVGTVVTLSMLRELGPVLTALMVGGRVGSGIAAELGSMTVTEQVDALRSLGADPVKKLVLPRVVATVLVLPLLTVLANVLSIAAASIIAKAQYGIGITYFFHSLRLSVKLSDFTGGVAKTFVFGFLLAVIACHEGLKTRGGTEGVGQSTKRTVVITSVVTLIADFILTTFIINLGH